MHVRRHQPRTLRGFQQLETRELLAAPELAPIPNQTLFAGAPLYVPLTAYDPDGDILSFSATVVQSSLEHSSIQSPVITPIIDHTNRNLRLSVRDYGDMVFELFERWAPRTTGRIIELVQQGFYTDVTFHRVIQHFVIQGGDPTGTGAGGSGLTFDDEFHPYLMHTGRGVLSMAKSTDDTNDSQFFITASDTRHLDFNHSVFGFLVRGEEVRQAIAAAPVDINNRPLTPVVIQSAEIFYDGQSRVLVLTAPLGTTGSAEVKVTVTDPEGNTAEQIFQVTVERDPYNSNAYLLPIAPIWTRAELPVTVAISAYDREQNPLIYGASPGPGVNDLSVRIEPTTGLLTVTPLPGAVGVRSVIVGVSDPASHTADPWDTQVVPVYVRPPTPTVQLHPSADTGASSSDGITRLNNAPNALLTFEVTGLVPGAEVSVLVDDVVVASAVAQGSSLVLQSTGEFLLLDGRHKVTAVQVLRDQPVAVGNFRSTVTLWSDESSPVWIVVDTFAPIFTSLPITQAAEGVLYRYQVTTLEEVTGPITYQLVTAPAGMRIDTHTGLITWLPDYDQAGTHSVVVRAIDTAGNWADQTFTIEVASAPDFLIAPVHNLIELQAWELEVQVVADHPPVTVFVQGALPEGMTYDAATRILRWTPSEAQGPGVYYVVLVAEDSMGLSRLWTLTLNVAEDNLPPRLLAPDEAEIREEELLELILQAVDDDLPPQDLVFSLIGQVPEGLTLDARTGTLRWRPTEAQGPGVYPITVRVSDAYGASDQKTLTIRVHEVYQPPQWETTGPFEAVVGTTFQVQLKAIDPDVPALPVQYRFKNLIDGMTLDANTGELRWEITRERWQALGMPSEVSVTVEAYKQIPGTGETLSTVRTFGIAVVDPWLLLMAAWGLSDGQPAPPAGSELSPQPQVGNVTETGSGENRRLKRDASESPASGVPASPFSGATGWLNRPSAALGLTNEVLDIFDKIEEEFLRGRLPEELLELLFMSTSDHDELQSSVATDTTDNTGKPERPSAVVSTLTLAATVHREHEASGENAASGEAPVPTPDLSDDQTSRGDEPTAGSPTRQVAAQPTVRSES